jgi:hypothetical protein
MFTWDFQSLSSLWMFSDNIYSSNATVVVQFSDSKVFLHYILRFKMFSMIKSVQMTTTSYCYITLRDTSLKFFSFFCNIENQVVHFHHHISDNWPAIRTLIIMAVFLSKATILIYTGI